MTDDVGHGQLRRLRGTANTSRVLPVVHVGRSVDEFYDRLKTTSDAGRKLPDWCLVTFCLLDEHCGLISLVQGEASCT